MKNIQPEVFKESFTCPHCGVLAKQDWDKRDFQFGHYKEIDSNQLRTAKCQYCNETSVWVLEKMVFPDTGNAPFPNPEMPDSVKTIYMEAASIANKSPKGAAALLRLALQVLCKELGEQGNNINKDIGELVKKGLPKIVQQSLDIVRVTGNDAVHPGQIDTDNINVVNKLFELTNVIIEYMISLPNKVNGLYNSLPEEKKEGIKKRDK